MTAAPSRPPQARSDTSPALAVLRALFARLEAEDIRHCHWKSNEHVDRSLVGATDVDVLVDRAAMAPLTRILTELDFKRFVVKPGLGYPGIEDYVGFDQASGALTHVHVHFQLTLGEKFLKGHRLPWEELYLTTRVKDEALGLYLADPALELVVLVVRAAMKLRARDLVLAAVGKPYFRGGLLREFRWLAARVSPERVGELATRLLGAEAGGLFPAVIAAGGPSLSQLRRLRHDSRPALREYRLYDQWAASGQALSRELALVWWKLRNWYHRSPTRSTRTVPQGGVLIAFLGADGAGKSTILTEIAQWLSREVAVVSTYGGNGKGSAGWPRRCMEWVGALRRGVRKATTREGAVPASDRRSGQATTSPIRAAWVLALANERRDRALQARRARGRGMVVLSDRLSQSQFPGWNDGPRLSPWIDHPSRWRRAAARWSKRRFTCRRCAHPIWSSSSTSRPNSRRGANRARRWSKSAPGWNCSAGCPTHPPRR